MTIDYTRYIREVEKTIYFNINTLINKVRKRYFIEDLK